MENFVTKIGLGAAFLILLLVIFYFLSSHFFMSTRDKWHDWETIAIVENPAKSMSAVLERNVHFGSTGYKPLIQVSLFEKSGLRRVVWSGGEKSSPILNWRSDAELIIAYQHNISSGYQPELNVDGIDYSVSLDMNLDSASSFRKSWGDGWNWMEKTIVQNSSKEIQAVIEQGKHSDAAPLIRILLRDTNSEALEVWTGVESSTKPIVTWINDNVLRISVVDYHLYSYYPARRLNKKTYKIELQKR